MINKIVKHYDDGTVKLVEYQVNNKIQNPVINKPAISEYYQSGNIMIIQNWYDNKKHGISKYFNENGNLECELHWNKGCLHRKDLPAIINYYPNGKIKSESFWQNDDYYSELDKPVYIEYKENGSMSYKFKF